MAIATGTAIAIGATVTAGATAYSASVANKQRKSADRRANAAAREVEALKESRQEIINPYSNVENLSGLAQDLSGQMSNPFAQLGVATKSAEIKMEQTDMALANTLDTLRSTGASAGGATALAQAALASKKGVAASIEEQEVANEKLRAQGEQQLQQAKITEQQRLQNIAISEGQRLQNADIAGQQFMFQTQAIVGGLTAMGNLAMAASAGSGSGGGN